MSSLLKRLLRFQNQTLNKIIHEIGKNNYQIYKIKKTSKQFSFVISKKLMKIVRL